MPSLTAHQTFISAAGSDGSRFLVDLTYLLQQEGDTWVATCAELGTSTFGDTVPEALTALNEGVGMQLAEAEAGKYLKEYLAERGAQLAELPATDSSASGWRPIQPALAS